MFKFSGEPQSEDVIESIYQEAVVNKTDSSSEPSEELP